MGCVICGLAGSGVGSVSIGHYHWLGDGRGGLSNSWSFSLASGITSSSSVSMPRIINWAGVLV